MIIIIYSSYFLFCSLLLFPLSLSLMTSTLTTAAVGYQVRPVDVTVAKGESVVFRCGAPTAFPNLTFTFYGSKSTYNLTCPYGYVEAIPQVRWSTYAPVFTLHVSVHLNLLHHFP